MTDAEEFTRFMVSYQDMVFTTALRLVGKEAQAEDIAQEVFLRAFDHFAELAASPTAGGWLKTVARNLSLNHLTRYRNRWRFFSEFQRDGADPDEGEPEFPAPDRFAEALESEGRRAWIEAGLRDLPDRQRVPLVLYHFEEMSYDQIAVELGVSLSKVKTDILRGRRALAVSLAQHAAAFGETVPVGKEAVRDA